MYAQTFKKFNRKVKKGLLFTFLLTVGSFVLMGSVYYFSSQETKAAAEETLVIEGITTNNIEPGIWYGVSVPRSAPILFTYQNNLVTSVNTIGYMLEAGNESPSASDNNLTGENIVGNKFIWNGTDMTSITHGIFTGYNINAVIKYNYLDKVPMGVARKSNGMTNTSGGIAYNIIKSPNVGIVVKGMNNVNIYNNTFYTDRLVSQSRALIDIYKNTDDGLNGSATGTKIFNNIFYTKYQVPNISVYENEDLIGFESDYNLFWSEAGDPVFKIAGVLKTFSQWQALGYDTHSVVVNPNFLNFTDFIPKNRLDYGTNLSSIWQSGLSANATWTIGSFPATADQNGIWQVGARILSTSNPVDRIAPVITNFSIASSSLSSTINIQALIATDLAGVTGYKLTESTTIPVVSDVGWTANIPTTYTFLSDGTKTLYAWAKDAAGNVSTPWSASVVIAITTDDLIIEGTVVNNIEPGLWYGVNIPRTAPINFSYKNNSVTSLNSSGYMLEAGGDSSSANDNNLAGENILGNKFIWNGTDMTNATVGIFTGYNINAVIKYNYIDKVPIGIARKSDGMVDTSGSIAYNIIKNPQSAIVVKGMKGIKIYNNTFYIDRLISQSRALVDIYKNTDDGLNGSATGTKIFNNIFYTKHQVPNIHVYENEDLEGFESDYNIFWSEEGAPVFKIAGVLKTFKQWQALGYDKHSTVVNPRFINFTDFIPVTRLDYGTNLGSVWQSGLAAGATWGTTSPAITNQSNLWQVGARILESDLSTDIISPVVNSFVVPSKSSSLNITISSFTATDTFAVTGYKITESTTTPLASDAGWLVAAPTSYAFLSTGTKTLYAWAKDAAGNISAPASQLVSITISSGGGGGGGGGGYFPSINVSTSTSTISVNDLIITYNNQTSTQENFISEAKNFVINEKKLVTTINKNLAALLSGRILLQVENHGEAWYINPNDKLKYYLGNPEMAFSVMRTLGVGISNKNIEKIKIADYNLGDGLDNDNDGLSNVVEDALGSEKNNSDTNGNGTNDKTKLLRGLSPVTGKKLEIDKNFTKKLLGQIFLQIENHGEAWYINPVTGTRYYLGLPSDAYSVMRALSLGISNSNLRTIGVGEAK